MRHYLFLLLSLLLSSTISAQVGINAGYRTISAESWENFFQEDDFLNGGFKIGVDYWFRLKKRRIEFTPELSYSRFSGSNVNPNGIASVEQDFNANFFGFAFNTNLYLLDFASDCDCPTFSKDGSILDAGFFVQLSPGLAYGNFNTEQFIELVGDNEERRFEESNIAFKFGIGLGLDIGINDIYTITPLITWQRIFGMEWEDLNTFSNQRTIPDNANNTSDIDQLFFGIKLGIRLDELSGY